MTINIDKLSFHKKLFWEIR